MSYPCTFSKSIASVNFFSRHKKYFEVTKYIVLPQLLRQSARFFANLPLAIGYYFKAFQRWHAQTTCASNEIFDLRLSRRFSFSSNSRGRMHHRERLIPVFTYPRITHGIVPEHMCLITVYKESKVKWCIYIAPSLMQHAQRLFTMSSLPPADR